MTTVAIQDVYGHSGSIYRPGDGGNKGQILTIGSATPQAHHRKGSDN